MIGTVIAAAVLMVSTVVQSGAMPTIVGPAATDDYVRCTDRFDYADDPRPNADINLLGELLGECPPPIG